MGRATLVIMAAGIGSRFKGGIKQLEPVGPNGEIIMDYSIYDAVEAGFDKVVFIIRKSIEKDFREIIGNRIEKKISVEYAFQEVENIPEKFRKTFADRTKPWGTGQAILCCKGIVKEPFLVINADDYYGKEAYKRAFDYLTEETRNAGLSGCMVSFILDNTLSENGGVTRGVCQVDEHDFLKNILEAHNIIKDKENGTAHSKEIENIDLNTIVSMNMWGLSPDFIDILGKEFDMFLEGLSGDYLDTEFLLPNIIGKLLAEKEISIKVLKSNDKWFGITYKEDKPVVVSNLKKIIEEGQYAKMN